MIYNSESDWQEMLAVARGDKPADILFTNCKVVDVFSGKLIDRSLAIHHGRIVGMGEYEASEVIDIDGAVIAPGFIEGHIHIESSKLTPSKFASIVMPHGTTTVIADPHEIANVQGVNGIRFMIEDAKNSPLDIYYVAPSCVPATDMETAGAFIDAEKIEDLLHEETVIGIGEMMNFPGTYMGDSNVLAKLQLGLGKLPIDGHSPGLRGKELTAYLIAGPATDHESFTVSEAREKLELGMRIMIREGSSAKNLSDLLPLVTPDNQRRCMFVTDDRNVEDLMREGHLDYTLRLAVENGLNPVTAIRMVTLNTAEAFSLLDRGGIRPGWIADLTILKDLRTFEVLSVWKSGKLIAQNNDFLMDNDSSTQEKISTSLRVRTINLDDTRIEDKGKSVRVIQIVPNQIVTEEAILSLPTANGYLTTSLPDDVCKLMVIERHTGESGFSLGFVKGLGIREGAIGSTVAHDSHNIIVAGMDDESIIIAANRLIESGGGQVVVDKAGTVTELPLPVAGLMTDKTPIEVRNIEQALAIAVNRLGSNLIDPFMTLSFLSLPVIPKLKLTDKGLVDVDKFEIVSLYT